MGRDCLGLGSVYLKCGVEIPIFAPQSPALEFYHELPTIILNQELDINYYSKTATSSKVSERHFWSPCGLLTTDGQPIEGYPRGGCPLG
jgi:hypothetical protein